MSMTRILAALLVLLPVSTPAQALPPLHENPHVVRSFYAIGLADEIRDNCRTIEPRMIEAYMFLRSLQKYALDAGYTQADIDALLDNREAKNALRKTIRRDLKQRGASKKTPEGYCTVGREEIAKGSTAGRLLRVK